MGKFVAIICSLILTLLCLATCNNTNNENFLNCMSMNSLIEVGNFVHSPHSPNFSFLLKNAEKNSRWLNSTSEFPLFVVAPSDEGQIQAALLCSKRYGLQLRIKSGGHDYEGLSFRSKTPFVMIDLYNFRSIKIDIKDETAWIQSGVTLGQLYYAIAQKSKVHAFPGGLCPSVGSGGLISGGGLGTLLRKYGLAADNVMDAQVMDADGQVLDRETMGEDYFWAIRGGGGASFGIILAWKLKLVRIPKMVTAFTIRRKLNSHSIKLLQRWENVAHKFPEDLFMRIILQNPPPVVKGGKKIVQVSFQGLFLGMADKLVPLLNQSFPEFKLKLKDCFHGPIVKKNCKEKPCIIRECYQISWAKSVVYIGAGTIKESLEYLVSRNSTNPSYKAKSDFVTTPIPEKGWKMIKNMFLEEDVPIMILDPFGGKMSQISESAIPFPHRKGVLYNIQYLVDWKINEDSEIKKHIEWMRRLHQKMEPFVSKSPRTAYLNYRDLDLGVNGKGYEYEQAKSWGEMYFKDNFKRLTIVKTKVDPNNFFRNEQSIPPL